MEEIPMASLVKTLSYRLRSLGLSFLIHHGENVGYVGRYPFAYHPPTKRLVIGDYSQYHSHLFDRLPIGVKDSELVTGTVDKRDGKVFFQRQFGGETERHAISISKALEMEGFGHFALQFTSPPGSNTPWESPGRVSDFSKREIKKQAH